MQIQSAFRPQEAALKPCKYVVRAAKHNVRKSKNSTSDRDFYRLAASLANPDLDDKPTDACDATLNVQDFHASKFLESSYQEKSPIFMAQGLRLKPVPLTDRHVKAVLEKWLCATNQSQDLLNQVFIKPKKSHDGFFLFDQPEREITQNGVSFSVSEQATLLALVAHDTMHQITATQGAAPLSALDFHVALAKNLHKELCRPILLRGRKSGQEHHILIDRARLFCSNRMHLKSLQINGGADPSIRYYHAAFQSSERPLDHTDVLYWLRFNEGNQPHYGEFIEAVETSFLPKNFICPHEQITNICTKAPENQSNKMPWSFVENILQMYLGTNR